MRPNITTDAYEDDQTREVPFIFLAGPIKHWWTCWGSPEHDAYVAYRNSVRAAIIDAGYLTYAPWDAIKGTWNPAAQAVNDAAIAASNLVLVLTPYAIPADGTEEEKGYADRVKTPWLWVPPQPPAEVVAQVEALVGPGHPYED